MSKVFFTVSFYHDGPSRRPQFSISTLNGYNIQMQGLDFKSLSFGNANLGDGFRHRFEYLVGGGPSFTRLSLVMNTTALLPQMSWASPHPTGAPRGKGPRGPPQKRRENEPPSLSRYNSLDHGYSSPPKALTRSSSNSRLSYNDHTNSQLLIDSTPFYSESSSPRPKRINRSYTRNQRLYSNDGDSDSDRNIDGNSHGDRNRDHRRLRGSSCERERPRISHPNAQSQSSRNYSDDERDERWERQNVPRRKSKYNGNGETLAA